MVILLLLFIIALFNENDSAVVITRFDDSCDLDPKLIEEIESYRNVTKYIMDDIVKRSGPLMWDLYVNFIDKFGARPAGTEVLEQAITHMVNLTKTHGLQDVITEPVEIPHWVRGFESIQMTSPRTKNVQLLGLGPSVSTPVNGITAEIVVVKSFEELDALNKTDVNGKIVVYNAPYVTYGDTVIYRSQGATNAAKKGAVAALVRSITPFSLYTPHTGAQSYADDVKKIPAAAITIEDAELMERLCKDGYKVVLNLTMLNTLDTKQSRNTLIDLKGKETPDKMVIVSGHIDSWDVGQGAMDDGGGMFISWFAPVILNELKLKPRRTLRAILWTSEEPGLVGAFDYLKKHEQELSNINFIMESDEGTFKPLGLDVGGTKQTRCVIAEILKIFSPINNMKESERPGSDIEIFVGKGVPGASLLNENDRYFWFHHSEADTMSVQNKDDVINCAAFWTAVSYVIADLSADIPR